MREWFRVVSPRGDGLTFVCWNVGPEMIGDDDETALSVNNIPLTLGNDGGAEALVEGERNRVERNLVGGIGSLGFGMIGNEGPGATEFPVYIENIDTFHTRYYAFRYIYYESTFSACQA